MKNALFIWIPKNAGSTIKNILGISKRKNIESINRFIKKRGKLEGRITFGHINCSKLIKSSRFNGNIDKLIDFYKNSFKFYFTRNPYDRTVSLYAYLISIYGKKRILPRDTDFLNFCRNIKIKGFLEVGLTSNDRVGLTMCNPQVNWLENINADFVGRFENLETDINKLAKILDIDIVEKIPQRNRSHRKNYESYYCKESKQIIEDLYAKDFQYLDYKIENINNY